MACQHENVDGDVALTRIKDAAGGEVFVAHVGLKCFDCGETPLWLGAPISAPSVTAPTVDRQGVLLMPFKFGVAP